MSLRLSGELSAVFFKLYTHLAGPLLGGRPNASADAASARQKNSIHCRIFSGIRTHDHVILAATVMSRELTIKGYNNEK
jgi:hypothetical protein